MVQLDTAADTLTTFEHERLQPALREVSRSHESIVTTTYYDRIVFHPCYPRLKVFQHLQRRIASGRTHDAAAGMRRRAAHVEVLDRRAILRPTRRGPQKEKLFERQLTLKNISFRQAKLTFEIEWRHHLSIANQFTDVRRVLGDRVDHRVAKLVALLVPGSFLQVVRRVLHEARHHVFARRRD